MIHVHGEAYSKNYNYKCTLESRTDQEAVFLTKSKPSHIVRLTPRYTGSRIGSLDCKEGTICAFFFDGEYVALALFIEQGNDIEVIVHEY